MNECVYVSVREKEGKRTAQAPPSLPPSLPLCFFFSAYGIARTGGHGREMEGGGGGGRAWTGLDSVGLRLGVQGGYLTGYGG